MVIAICLCKNYSSSWLYRHCHGNRITSWCLCFRTLETGEISHCGYVFWIQKTCSYITYNRNVVIYWKVIWVYYEIMSFSFSDVLSKHFMLELFFCTMPAKIAWFLNHQEVISNYRILKGGGDSPNLPQGSPIFSNGILSVPQFALVLITNLPVVSSYRMNPWRDRLYICVRSYHRNKLNGR